LLIRQLAGTGTQQPGGADLAPLSSKRNHTIESASVITAGLIGVSLPKPTSKKGEESNGL